MSLINDALKKAQKQRTEGNTPATEISPTSASTEPLQRIARREKPVGFRSQLLLISGGAVAAVILLGVSAVFYFRPTEKPAAAPQPAKLAILTPSQATPAAAPAPSTAPTPATTASTKPEPLALTVTLPATSPAPASTPTSSTAQSLSVTLPTSSPTPTPAPSAPVAAPTQFVIQTPPPAVAAPVVATPVTPAAPAPAERPKASTRMIGVIEHYKVGGIRVGGTESKVLMNDKVYRINDIVDHELGIRLTGIEAKALTFEDTRGAVHIRIF